MTLPGHLAVVVLVALVLGAATAVGQQHLSDAWRPVANSAGSWTLVAFFAASCARRVVIGALVGGLTLLALLAGYAIASEVRGYAVSLALVVFWGAASVTVGPVVGAGASLLRGADDRLAAVGVGLMSGLLVGEGVYGLTIVDATTEPPWWIASIVIGVVLVPVVLLLRHAAVVGWSIAVATTVVVAGGFWLVYQQDLIGVLSP